MPECPKCEASIQKKINEFANRWKIGGGLSLVKQRLVVQIEAEYPGFFQMLATPGLWVGEPTPVWFPVSSEKLKNTRFHFEVVHAPLSPDPLIAACVRVTCPQCDLHHRIIHLNVAAFILNTHLAAAALDEAVNYSHIHRLMRDLMETGLQGKDTPFPMSTREAIGGIAWAILHEYGHVLAAESPVPLPDNINISDPKVKEETDADVMAFRVLQHRLHAKGVPLGEAETNLISDIEVFVRTAALIIAKCVRMPARLEDMPLMIAHNVPSLRLRLLNLQNYVSGAFRLLSNDLQASLSQRSKLHQRLDSIIDSLLK